MRKLRILIAKVGLDGHDRGAKSVAVGLRDAGMEVIYTGIRQTPEAVVSVAIQEDVDAIGISSLSGAHMTAFPKIVKLLEQKGVKDMLIFGGGIIAKNDIPELHKIGVERIFLPGTRVQDVVDYLQKALPD
jgi:methylmalonyl-CoA mutase C-terminal domain/subunit